jgi:hypothetical protein
MIQKIIFLKFKSNKEQDKLNYQIKIVSEYLLKRYGYKYVSGTIGTCGDDFIKEIARLRLTFK